MTDNEIIKFMQCVMGNDANCSECAYQKTLPFPSCRRTCAKDALDLINRQKAEIEKLNIELTAMRGDARAYRSEAERLEDEVNRLRDYCDDYGKFVDEPRIRSEAIKEFAERLCDGRVSNDPVVIAVKVELEMMEVETNQRKKEGQE